MAQSDRRIPLASQISEFSSMTRLLRNDPPINSFSATSNVSQPISPKSFEQTSTNLRSQQEEEEDGRQGIETNKKRLDICCSCRRQRKKVLEKEEKDEIKIWKNDYVNSNWLFRMLFTWTWKLQRETLRREVEYQDLWTIPNSLHSEVVVSRIRINWEKELKEKPPEKQSLFWVLFRTFKKEILLIIFYKLCWLVFILLMSSLFFNQLLSILYLASSNIQAVPYITTSSNLTIPYTGFFWALGIGAADVSRSLSISAYWWTAIQTGLMAKGGVSLLIFEKLTRIRRVDSVGGVVTLITNDGQRIMDAFQYGLFVFSTPISLIVIIIIGCFYLSAAFAIGLVLLILFFPIQVRIGKRSQQYRRVGVKISDERVTLMSEILRAIKLVKLYEWGDNFSTKVSKVRQRECAMLTKSANVRATNQTLSFTIPSIVIVVCFCFHTLVLGYSLSAAEAFTTIALLNVARFPLTVLPQAIRGLNEGAVACRRLQQFLLLDNEIKPQVVDPKADHAISFQNCIYTWDQSSIIITNNNKNKEETPHNNGENNKIFQLEIPSLTIPKNKITLVVGKLASGKSSLLAGAILGEMVKTNEEGEAIFQTDQFAYVSQNPFIFNATVVENIVMNETYDEDRIERVIEACALEPDIIQFPGGLQTEMGERGINGSGGQKARIALARALYSMTAQILVLDDVLSAVDTHVRRHLWKTLREHEFLKNKTIILATHSGEILQEADYIIVCSDGKVSEAKPFAEYNTNKEKLEQFLSSIGCSWKPEDSTTVSSVKDEAKELARGPSVLFNKANSTNGVLMQREKRQVGGIKLSTIKTFLFKNRSIAFTVLVCFIVLVNEALIAVGTGVWISAWTQNIYHQTNEFYLGILGGIALAILLISEIRGILFARMMLNAAKIVHDDSFHTLMDAQLSFFDTTPIGRILSRFSTDIDTIDVNLPDALETSFSLILRAIASLIIIAIIFVWFVLPIAIVLVIFSVLFLHFRVSLRMMKRIDQASKSPLLSLVESTAGGLTTLRASNSLNKSIQTACGEFNSIATTGFAFQAISRLISVRLELVTSTLNLITAFFCVLFASTTNPGLAGLALTSILQIGGIFQFAMRQLMEAESMFAAVERLVDFTQTVPTEPNPCTIETEKILPQWPSQGKIDFVNVSARYRTKLPFVLNDMSFSIPGGSSCGLVGRTGSSKSSCLLALFRIFQTEHGRILIDDVDISQVDLHVLRKQLSIIPQDPSLFKGTIRSNLDPFNEFSDLELNQALEKTHLQLEGVGLDDQVSETGGNFSQGERQLFCFARAVLKNTKIVCLDEATSSVDSATSKLIGETMKQLFIGKTLIIVAHRLDVVSSLDYVAVLDAGKCIQFGDPKELIELKRGPFFDLWNGWNG